MGLLIAKNTYLSSYLSSTVVENSSAAIDDTSMPDSLLQHMHCMSRFKVYTATSAHKCVSQAVMMAGLHETALQRISVDPMTHQLDTTKLVECITNDVKTGVIFIAFR